MLTIVMYHYVRDVERTAYPSLHARSVADFEGQLDYLERRYEPVCMADVYAAFAGERPLPPSACLLTFDDGLADHRDAVLPALARRGLSGVFSPTVASTLERRLTDVHKSQFVLAAETDHGRLLEEVLAEIEAPPRSAGVVPEERYDEGAGALLKELLQNGRPDGARRSLLDRLFRRLVSDDEHAFADELYLSLEDLRRLVREGMEVAGHGVEHRLLAGLGRAEQQREIEGALRLLRSVQRGKPARWTMCYPSGGYDETTLELCGSAGCVAGLTVAVGLVRPDTPPLELPRLDTNDLPLSGDADPVEWTLAAAES